MEKSDLYKYQERAVQHILDIPYSALWLDMGLGKTISTLTAIEELMFESFEVKKVLLIAPLRVCNTVWKQEAEGWEHTSFLKFSNLAGGKRNMEKGLQRNADIYLINRENVTALVKHLGRKWIFDMVVIDESSSFKSHKSQRFRALKHVRPKIKRMVQLTGTPSPNGYMDLWSQFYLLDMGARLGKTISNYRSRFFESDFMGYNYNLVEGSDAKIKSLITDVVLSMKSEDYLELPEVISLVLENNLEGKLLKQYKAFEKDMLLQIDGDEKILAMTAATLSNKLLQFSSGNVYSGDEDNRVVNHFHKLKLETLNEIVEDSPNENLLVAYNYKHELEALTEAFPDAVVLDKKGECIKDWNDGKIKMLLAHPASAGHGLNLQYGGSTLVWYGFNWSLELYQQFNKRLHRNGQQNIVRILHIAVGEIETRLMKSLSKKDATQSDLLHSLKGE